MPNPFHDPFSGEFCSKSEINARMLGALTSGEFEKYSAFRSILANAERLNQERIFRGFTAVREQNITALEELLADSDLSSMTSPEESAMFAGLSKNASPETLDVLLKSQSFHMDAFREAYTHLSEEDKCSFLANNKNLRASKFGFLMSELVRGAPTMTNKDVIRGRMVACLSREVYSAALLDAVRRACAENLLIVSLRNAYQSGERTVWPFTTDLRSQEVSIVENSSSIAGNPNRLLFAEHSSNPETLAILGMSDSATFDFVMNNPNTTSKTLATILAKSTSLSSAQYVSLKIALEKQEDLPEHIRTSLNTFQGLTVPVIAEGEIQPLRDSMRAAAHRIKYQQKRLTETSARLREAKWARPAGETASLDDFALGSEVTQIRNDIQAQQNTFDSVRGKLDASDENYNALIKQKSYLEKSVNASVKNNDGYKTVVGRLQRAEKERRDSGDHKSLKNLLASLTYSVEPIKTLA